MRRVGAVQVHLGPPVGGRRHGRHAPGPRVRSRPRTLVGDRRRLDPPVAACSVDQLGQRRPGPDDVAGPARDELDRVEGSEQPVRCRRVAAERRVGDPDLEDGVGVRDRDAGQVVAEREFGGLFVALADEPGVVRLDPVDEGTSVAIRASRNSDPRCESNGCGMPTRPPCSRTAAIASVGGQAGRHGTLQEEPDEIAVERS